MDSPLEQLRTPVRYRAAAAIGALVAVFALNTQDSFASKGGWENAIGANGRHLVKTDYEGESRAYTDGALTSHSIEQAVAYVESKQRNSIIEQAVQHHGTLIAEAVLADTDGKKRTEGFQWLTYYPGNNSENSDAAQVFVRIGSDGRLDTRQGIHYLTIYEADSRTEYTAVSPYAHALLFDGIEPKDTWETRVTTTDTHGNPVQTSFSSPKDARRRTTQTLQRTDNSVLEATYGFSATNFGESGPEETFINYVQPVRSASSRFLFSI